MLAVFRTRSLLKLEKDIEVFYFIIYSFHAPSPVWLIIVSSSSTISVAIIIPISITVSRLFEGIRRWAHSSPIISRIVLSHFSSRTPASTSPPYLFRPLTIIPMSTSQLILIINHSISILPITTIILISILSLPLQTIDPTETTTSLSSLGIRSCSP